ncbi:MAG: polysaccharide deacetylase family protein, partial [Elusimicrobia bacterium]|nr:polysaccharide deacetylase family protein [Elusimicrobiota bacterium]
MIEFILGSAALAFSARWNWWRKKTCGLPVLMYHKIGEPPKNSRLKKLWVSPQNFARQIDYLLRHEFTPILFSQIPQALEGKIKKPVLITFDDGYQNNYTLAYPIIKEKKAKANIFLVCDTIGNQNAWHNPKNEDRLPMLNCGEIRQMQNSGLVEFGSHTLNHPSLTTIDLQEVSRQLCESKKILEEKLGRPLCAFAYPYGA